MCGRYTVVTKLEKLEKRFSAIAEEPNLYVPSTNVGPGKMAPVITSQDPGVIQFFYFGLTPAWSKKRMFLFNARSEGDNNKANAMDYAGSMGIIQKPAFRKPIRSKRCLVPADCFFEGPEVEKLSKPYVVYLKNGVRPFAFAGIYDEWADPDTGEVIHSFSIITTQANRVTNKLGHHRSPVILKPEEEQAWLSDSTKLNEVTSMLHPYPSDKMNAYPVHPKVKNPRSDGLDLLAPIGERLFPEYEFKLVKELTLEGMGYTRARERQQKLF